jgi:hypothetical protein
MVKSKTNRLSRRLSVLLTIACAIFTVAGCDDFSFYGLIDDAKDGKDTGLELQISPISATVPAGADLLFSAAGGKRPYSYSLVSGNGSVDPDSGKYTAPATASVDIVRLIDANGASVDSQIVVVE